MSPNQPSEVHDVEEAEAVVVKVDPGGDVVGLLWCFFVLS
jgi:hypothetical protein